MVVTWWIVAVLPGVWMCMFEQCICCGICVLVHLKHICLLYCELITMFIIFKERHKEYSLKYSHSNSLYQLQAFSTTSMHELYTCTF